MLSCGDVPATSAYLMALPDLSVVRLGAMGLAALLQLVEASLGTLLSLLRVVGVVDGTLCNTLSVHMYKIKLHNLTEATSNLYARHS